MLEKNLLASGFGAAYLVLMTACGNESATFSGSPPKPLPEETIEDTPDGEQNALPEVVPSAAAEPEPEPEPEPAPLPSQTPLPPIEQPDPNDLPAWSLRAEDMTHMEDQPMSVRVEATDADHLDGISYSLDPDGTTCDDGAWEPQIGIDPKTGEITGTPHNDDVGECLVKIVASSARRVNDSKRNNRLAPKIDTLDDVFKITVLNANDVPFWGKTVSDFSHPEDQAVKLRVAAYDVDVGETPSYSLDLYNMTCDDGSWQPPLTIEADSGRISGTPRNPDIGNCSVRIAAKSGTDTIYNEFVITVGNANDLPNWVQTIPDQTTPEDQPFVITAVANDVDPGDTPSYTLDVVNMTCDDGAWNPQISIDSVTGQITGTPRNADVGTCTVKVIAKSGNDILTDEFAVTVTNTNDLPTWVQTIPDQTSPEDQPFVATAQAIDIDPGETPVYSLGLSDTTCDDGTWSPNISIDPASGVITGTPRNGDVGTCTVRVLATSGADSITDDFSITVTNVNDLPTWNKTIADFSHPEDAPLSLSVAASDPDANESPTYSFDESGTTCNDGTWSPNITINPTSGVITGTPRNDDVGTCTVVVIATSGTDVISDTFVITVLNTNDVPTWDSMISDFSHPEDVPVAITVKATDVDIGETPTYGLEATEMTCDDGAWIPDIAINPVSGVITGTPTNADIGTCTVKVSATSGSDTIYDDWTITVANINDLPRWTQTLPDLTHPEDVPLSVTAQATDPDAGETPVYSLDLAGMTCDDGTWNTQISIDPSTGEITGTPRNGDVGSCTVKVVASSGGDAIVDDFTITVTNTNDLPAWVNTIPDFSHPEDVPLIRTAAAVDVDPMETPRYSLDPSHSTCDDGTWMPNIAIDPVSGAITGTPRNDDVGTCTVRVVATSGSDSIFDDFAITVTNVNDPPTWVQTLPDVTHLEDVPFVATASAFDVDVNDTPTYSFDSVNMTCDDGAWIPNIKIDPMTGEISGTPHNADVGSCTVRVAASSGGDTIYDQFTITIMNVNDLPVWDRIIADFSHPEDTPLILAVTAKDDDAGETPSYSLDAANMTCDDGSWNPPITIDTSSGQITGTPRNADVGNCEVKVVATSGSDTITQEFTINVTNTNDLPRWENTIADQMIPEDQSFSVVAQASDEDVGETPLYSLDYPGMTCDDGSWSPGITIDSITGEITGTPRNADVGSCSVRVVAQSGTDTIFDEFTITVLNVNDPPTWSQTIPDFSHPEDQPLVIVAQASDPDAGETPTYSLDLANMTCDDGAWSPNIAINSSTGAITGTPRNADIGDCSVRVVAQSGSDSITDDFTITVLNVNDPPYWIATIGDTSHPEDAPLTLVAQAADPDPGDSVSYSLNPNNMTCDKGSWLPNIAINSSTGEITGTPTNNDVGVCSVEVIATSNGDSIIDTFNIIVTNTNDPPTWYTEVADFSVLENTAISVMVSAIDVDVGETPTYSLDATNTSCDDGSWSPQIAVDATTGAISGTPRNGDIGVCVVTILATSGPDTISTSFTVTVAKDNNLPVWDQTIANFSQPTYVPLNLQAKASDVDPGDTPTFSLDYANMTCDDGSWVPTIVIDPVTGVFTGTPTFDDVGMCSVRVLAASAGDQIVDEFTITVIHTLEKVEMSFAASSVGSNTATFSLTDPFSTQTITMSNQTSSESQTFTQITRPQRTDVHSQGFGGTSELETFNQNDTGLLDILIVVDNSQSMLEEQQNLSTKLSNLLTYVSGSDWQIGVVTTDPADGCLRALVQKSDPDPDGAFSAAVSAGAGGSNNERGIQTAVAGLKGECLAQPWVRANSSIAVLILSDEDNCNTQGLGCVGDPWETEQHLLDYLASIRTLGVDARVYSIIWHPSHGQQQCHTADFQGEAYARAVDATGGAWGSICDTDYTTTLEAISDNIADTLKNQFALMYPPDPGSVELRVDGALITSGYTINGNILEFQTPPAKGSTITIQYIHGATPKFDTFSLSDSPALDTLTVTFNGNSVPISDYSVNAAAKTITFAPLPPDNANIRIEYLVDLPLQSQYDIGSDAMPSSISTTIDGTPETGFSYSGVTGLLTFSTAPPDGSTIRIDFTKNSGPILSYPVALPAAVDPGDLSLTDSQSGQSVVGSYNSATKAVEFDQTEFVDGRQIDITYFDPTVRDTEYVLPHSPISGTITVNNGNPFCEEPSGQAVVTGNKLTLVGCTLNRNLTQLSISYDYVIEYHTSFTVTAAAGAPQPQDWRMYVDGAETSDFSISGHVATIPASLAHDAVVRITVEFPKKG